MNDQILDDDRMEEDHTFLKKSWLNLKTAFLFIFAIIVFSVLLGSRDLIEEWMSLVYGILFLLSFVFSGMGLYFSIKAYKYKGEQNFKWLLILLGNLLIVGLLVSVVLANFIDFM